MPVHVRIVTRRKVVFDGVADVVQAPGFLGEFGVLPDHERFLTLVRPGRLIIRQPEGESGFILGVGFAEAGPEHLTVLVDHCESIDAVDREKAQQDLHDAEHQLTQLADGTAEWEIAERKAWLARARLSV